MRETKEDPYRSEEIYEYVTRRMGYKPYKDLGCVTNDWNEWTLQDLLFKFGFQYGFVNYDTMIRCLKNLRTIYEFEKEILKYLKMIEK